MAITLPSKRGKPAVDTFASGAPDAATRRLRGRKVALTLTLPPEILSRIDGAAVRHERSRAAMMAVALREWLERDEVANGT